MKQSDAEVRVENRSSTNVPRKCPIWVNETGWSESKPTLARDIERWLLGTNYGVLVAAEVKYNQRANSKVAGHITFYTKRDGRVETRVSPTLVASKYVVANWPLQQISPAPSDPAADRITFTRAELFGDTLPLEPGQALTDIYTCDVATLRHCSAYALESMGLAPV